MLIYLRMLVDSFALRSGIARGQRGATLIEYALIVAVIALAIIVAWVALFQGAFTGLGNDISAALNPA